MKQQIRRFTPHQNSKVIGVLMAIVAVIFAVPFFLWLSYLDPEHSPPRILIMLLPLIYLIFGYVSVIVSCFCYNFMARFIGGIEYETKDP